MKCPVCKDESLVMTDRQGIEIDYCPNCRGVWLDRGELDKIIERTVPQQQSTAPTQAPRYQDEQMRSHGYGASHGHKKYKKKSLLGELFDF